MGGLCTGGTIKHHRHVQGNNNDYDYSSDNFSKDVSKKTNDGVEEEENYGGMNHSGFQIYDKKRTRHILDSGELNFNISTQFLNRRSAAARTPPTSKVPFFML